MTDDSFSQMRRLNIHTGISHMWGIFYTQYLRTSLDKMVPTLLKFPHPTAAIFNLQLKLLHSQ